MSDEFVSKCLFPLKNIRVDGGTQPRGEIDQNVVREYAEAITAGAIFPEAVVFYDGTAYWLADGFHRYWAHKQAGREDMLVEIKMGTRREAVLWSAGANATHGLRRTRADVQRAIDMLLADEEWAKWSDREIAKRVGCSDKTVGSRRPAKVESGAEFPHLTRRGSDGKQYPAKAVPSEGKTGGGKFAPGKWYVVNHSTGRIYTRAFDEQTEAIAAADEAAKAEGVHPRMLTVRRAEDIDKGPMAQYPLAYDWPVKEKHTAAEMVTYDQRFVERWKVGKQVQVDGSDVIGEITEVKINTQMVRVRRPDGHGGFMTHWVGAEKLTIVDDQIGLEPEDLAEGDGRTGDPMVDSILGFEPEEGGDDDPDDPMGDTHEFEAGTGVVVGEDPDTDEFGDEDEPDENDEFDEGADETPLTRGEKAYIGTIGKVAVSELKDYANAGSDGREVCAARARALIAELQALVKELERETAI